MSEADADGTDRIELVRCTRGHTVKRGSCTAIIGQLICPICECQIPGHSVDTDTEQECDRQ